MKHLSIHNVRFAFNVNGPTFFENITVSFRAGHVYFVQGKNGIGKTTFFSILQGTTPHNSLLHGRVIFDGYEYTIKHNMLPEHFCSHVKTVVQDVNTMIVTALTVRENLQLAQLPHYPGLKPLAHEIISPVLLDLFAINLEKSVYTLSGGQKQILAIMMSLQKPTSVLLLDEPTAALDEKNTEMVMHFLTQLAHELQLIIIIITHDKEVVNTYAQGGTVLISRQEDNDTRIVTQM